MSQNKKHITLRFDEDIYEILSDAAQSRNRSLANFVETLFLQKFSEESFVDDFEMEEILANEELMKDLKAGSKEAKQRKGKFV